MILTNQNGKKVYSDTEKLEQEMYEIANLYPEDESQDFIAQDSRYTVNNTYSSVRRNLLNWYHFKQNSSVLEVGAGMGALTGLLCDKLDHVVALEMSEKRAEVIRKRYPNRKNLTLVSDDIFTWETEKRFDYIVVVGVLEYAGVFCSDNFPYQKFVSNLTRFLKPDGTVLLAIENRFGLKYWCGASEDHLCKPFAGIRGYKEGKDARTFSKKELECFFANAGLINSRFFYVLPDYKFPTLIYTDNYKPNLSAIQKLAFSYVKGSSLICKEAELYKDIFENSVEGFFANSFLIEASYSDLSEQPMYIVGRGECKKEYRVSTLIYPNKTVIKKPMHNKALQHLKNIIQNEEMLKKNGIKIIPSELKNDNLFIPYCTASTAEMEYHKYLENNDVESLFELIKLLKLNLLKSAECINSSEISKLEKTFWISEELGPLLKNGYIDMNFSNSFFIDKELHFYDQEWCFPNVPLNFILFYAIRQSYLSFTGRTTIQLMDILKYFNIDTNADKFIEIERYFWNKILYRQEHFYDKDGWYNHFDNSLLLNNQFEKYKSEIMQRYNDVIVELENKNMHISHIENEYNQKCKEIEKKNLYIKDIETRNLSEENDLQEKYSYIKEIEASLEQKNEYIEQIEASLILKNSYIEKLEDNLEQKNQYLKHLEASLNLKNDYICQLEKTLNEKNIYIEKLEKISCEVDTWK